MNPNAVVIDFSLTLTETNLILQALSARPYAEVAQLISSMQQVAQKKISPPIEAS